MANQRRRHYSTREYTSYGNVAYKPDYEEDYAPARREAERSQPRPRVQPREHVAVRPEVEVRQQGAVSIFAVVGFLAVIVCVFLLLSAGIKLSMISHETFDFQDKLVQLKADEKKLLAEYELAYDLTEIERQMTTSGAMIRASAADTVYLDLSESDSVIYYEQASSGITGFVDRIEQGIQDLMS